MSPDHYESHLPTKELDRRERVAADVRDAARAAQVCLNTAQLVVSLTVADSPVCGPITEFAVAVEEARARLMVELYGIEGGRYVDTEKPNPGPRIVADLHRKITGGRF